MVRAGSGTICDRRIGVCCILPHAKGGMSSHKILFETSDGGYACISETFQAYLNFPDAYAFQAPRMQYY